MFWKKKKLKVPVGDLTEISAVDTWEVRWYSVVYHYLDSIRSTAFGAVESVEVFTSEKDARAFCNHLLNASNLLQNQGSIRARIIRKTGLFQANATTP